MTDLRSKRYEIYSLEQLSAGDSVIHRLHARSKLIATLVFLVCVMSFDRYALFRLAPYVFYPVLLLALADVPHRLVAKRTLVALPFCLFGGLSNLLFDTAPYLQIGSLMFTAGAISFSVILLRTLLCVAAVLVLVAVTPLWEITAELRHIHVPEIFVALLEMTYRYLGTLLEEAGTMYTAYQLRSGTKALAMRDMGSFVGQLLLRSFARAERVYSAMQCRGYPAPPRARASAPLRRADWAFLLVVAGGCLLARFFDLPALLAQGIGGLL